MDSDPQLTRFLQQLQSETQRQKFTEQLVKKWFPLKPRNSLARASRIFATVALSRGWYLNGLVSTFRRIVAFARTLENVVMSLIHYVFHLPPYLSRGRVLKIITGKKTIRRNADTKLTDINHVLKLKESRKTVHTLTGRCWDICFADYRPPSKLDGKTSTCLQNCVNRMIDASNFMVEHLQKMESGKGMT